MSSADLRGTSHRKLTSVINLQIRRLVVYALLAYIHDDEAQQEVQSVSFYKHSNNFWVQKSIYDRMNRSRQAANYQPTPSPVIAPAIRRRRKAVAKAAVKALKPGNAA
jgi:hypothetical protein